MERTGIAQLKASLSEYLAKVKAGQEVLVTERGHAIALIVPVSALDSSSRSIENLVQSGILKRPSQSLGKTFRGLPRARDRRGAVRKALLREREESN
ncbi:MAG: type II toxin-antitoxin system Phd/YefM family antitoxin [Acidobacteriota bacterium]